MKKKDESLGFAIYAVAKSSIAQSTWQQISIATLGSSGSVQKGDAAVVLGKPFGYAGAVGFGDTGLGSGVGGVCCHRS